MAYIIVTVTLIYGHDYIYNNVTKIVSENTNRMNIGGNIIWYAKMVHEHLLDCVIARDEAAEAGDKEQYKKQQYMAERCSNLLTNIQQRIDEHKPDQPLTPVEELV